MSIRLCLCFLAISAVLSGCQKNSYESCIEFQTEAAKRFHKEYPGLSTNLQSTIDNHVSMNCRGVK